MVVAAAASAGGKSAGVSSFRFERAVKNFGVATLRGVECLGVDAAFLARIVPLTQPTCLPTVALARDDMDLFSGTAAFLRSSSSRCSDWSPAKPDSELATDDVDDRPRPVRPRSTSASVRVGLSAPRGGGGGGRSASSMAARSFALSPSSSSARRLAASPASRSWAFSAWRDATLLARSGTLSAQASRARTCFCASSRFVGERFALLMQRIDLGGRLLHARLEGLGARLFCSVRAASRSARSF